LDVYNVFKATKSKFKRMATVRLVQGTDKVLQKALEVNSNKLLSHQKEIIGVVQVVCESPKITSKRKHLQKFVIDFH
jgi:hypothetical protein